MEITGVTSEEYERFLKYGGVIIVYLDRDSFMRDKTLEESPAIKPLLQHGFELPPTTLIYDDSAAMQLLLHGDTWTRIVTHTYRKGGRIVYRKVSEETYEAIVTVPGKEKKG